ncbi:trypsin-like peptidase domain-containing protein [Streptomyces sp. NPDC057257]|uniref:VMAP-C domain-containing protein n=1 Tax=Streptomyces sp. NPDC057257 TaxID=3346071 RepID=UPI003644D053
MRHAEWHARVECGGKVAGAGFLVSADKVLTCAHVVEGGDRAELTVSFPQRPGFEPVPARVVAHGGWAAGRLADRGDLAVLKLDREVGIAPAALASADAAHGDRRLVAYGFPAGYDEGTLAEYRITAGPFLISREWIQLEAWRGHGQPLVAGFSGAAVTLVDTGEVVGMVTAADRARDVRTGRMMPTDVIVNYWPDTPDLGPAPDLGPTAGASGAAPGLTDSAPGPSNSPSALAGPPPGLAGPVPGPGNPAAGFDSRPPSLVIHAPGPGNPTSGHAGTDPGRIGATSGLGSLPPGLAAPAHAPAHTHADHVRLRGLVEQAVRVGLECDPVRLYGDAAGPFDPPAPPEGFASLWAAAWFVLCEVDDPDTPTRFADRLDALLNAPARSGGVPDWAPILVEVRPSGAGSDVYRVEVSAYSGRRRHPVASDTVPEDRLPAYVQDHVEAAFRCLTPGADELIAFALPRDRLDLPVDRWGSAPDDPTPLGCTYPVVVTDHVRRTAAKRHVLTRVWDHLRTSEAAPIQRVACDCPDNPMKLRQRMRRPGACLAGFAAASPQARTRPHFEESVTAPAPVIVWSRRGCEAAGEAGCAGADDCPGTAFLDALDARVAHVPPAELPRTILALREEADAEEDHWARDIQLLWDDPHCFTDEHAGAVHLHSPIA